MAGRKVFQPATVLAATDVNEFLMDQAVMSFAGTAARASAIGTPTAGMVTYLQDTAALQFWNGTVWAPVGVDAFTTTGEKGQYLVSNGTAGIVWQNSISPLLLLGV